MEILDVRQAYNRYMVEWNLWTHPLKKDGWWYSENYYEEIMNAFEHTTGGLKIIFVKVEDFRPVK